MQATGLFPNSLLAVDIALAAIAFEFVLLLVWRLRAVGGWRIADVTSLLLPGACLLLALRAALHNAGAGAIGVLLAAALVAHMVDVRRRWRER
jgi:hypothetical protein